MKSSLQDQLSLYGINSISVLNRILRERTPEYGIIKLPKGCAVCSERNGLELHHLNYVEGITMLLCESCHFRVHFGNGLEHLNPIGKKQWLESTNRLERIEKIIIPTTKELMKRKGYSRLIKTIFNPNLKKKHRQHM
jgi:hypothetical protein